MSTLQHTSQLRVRTSRRLVLIVVIATCVLGGIAAGIVAIASNGSSSTPVQPGFAKAEPIYGSGTLIRQLPSVKASQNAQLAAQAAQRNAVPTSQTPGQRP